MAASAIRENVSAFFKGIGMGAANVIPGVSGGTIALITGIFERLINSIKSLDFTAIKLLFSGKIKEFAKHIDFYFLVSVLAGIAISIVSLAYLLEVMFEKYPRFTWSFFFGLILASVYFVGKTIEKWNISTVVSFILGTSAAIVITVLTPASENSSIIYLVLCGVVAACSMILPGLSGSFVLILLGNYQLVMIQAVSNFRLDILAPVVVGAGIGLLGFSHILSWVFKKFRDQTIALLTGFILGSLGILWPWKDTIYKKTATGEFVVKNDGSMVIESYDWFIPENFNQEVIIAIALMVAGIIAIAILEKNAGLEKSAKEI